MLKPIFPIVILTISFTLAQNLSSSKRGLIHIPSEYSSDDSIWDRDTSDLTWYYNYGAYPAETFDHTKLQFIPMLWGKPDESVDRFYQTVKGLVDGDMNITYAFGFNEPDGCSGGGSCIDAKSAAQLWIDEMEPLKEIGIKLGAPAVRGSPEGVEWLQSFYSHCDGQCTIDFLPLHWYGSFEGLTDYIGGMRDTYQNLTMWITEFAYPEVSLEESQTFYNQSSDFFDQEPYITHYSYFGSFRSDVSNVGPNVAMLNEGGQLTDIGAWCLGRPATGNLPKSEASSIPKSLWWLSFCIMLFTIL